MKKIIEKSLLNKIERFEAFEERLGVRFENITVKVDEDGKVQVLFELHSNNPTLEKNIRVECVAYDVDGKILGIEDNCALKDNFFGFQVFLLWFFEDKIADKIHKLRLYPKL